MQTSVRWSETSAVVDGSLPPINSVCFSPSGDHLIASCGVRVLVYAASTGTLLHSLKGHQNTVYCVEYSSDGKRFASGGADHIVIVWSNKCEGIVKYQHKESIQAIASNPVSAQLASVSAADWGLWEPDKPKVAKHALPAKGLCAAWTPDGQTLAIGLLDGTIMLLARGVEESRRIRRNAPVWSLAFNPTRDNGVDVLAVASWDQRLSFYNINAVPVGKERDLNFEPCSLSFFKDGEYMLISGSNHKVSLYTKDGSKLIDVASAEDWVWSCKQRPRQMQIACGSNSGSISSIELTTTTVHSIYRDQYAFRENMTCVMVHQLSLDKRMRINCNDYVKKLAVYRDRLAVQLEERIVIFELFYDDERNMRFQDIAQIRRRVECSLMCVTAKMVIFCHDRRLTMYDFQGSKRREWLLDSTIRYVKVAGGMQSREILLVGLKNGQALKIFVDNAFPTPLFKANNPIHCLDLSSTRTKLAVVDENRLLQLVDLENNNAITFTEPNVTAVCWNTDFEDMIAFSSGTSTLNIKTGALPPYQQPMRGLAVGFKANHLFNLDLANIMVVDVPHSYALYRYIDAKDFAAAYSIACRGVTEGDWKMLGMHALTNFELDIARRAFTRIHEVDFVELLRAIELRRHQGGSKQREETEDQQLLGDILAFQGKFKEAARQFIKCGSEDRAIEMYCDLKMWDGARRVCSDEGHVKDLIRQQARWAEDLHNYSEAASLYESCGDYAKAIDMMGQAGQLDSLVKICRALPKSEVGLITECAAYFRQHAAIPYALEAYEKVGNHRALIHLYVEQGDWRRAFAELDLSPQFARDVYLPWANWLADNDKFKEALEAFRAARWPQEAVRMMKALATNAVVCRKFREAAFYFVHLAEENGQFEDNEAPSDAQMASRIKQCHEFVRQADIYYAYSSVYAHATQPLPFNEVHLFRQARYLLAVIGGGTLPANVGKAEILYTLARAADRLDMVRTARSVFDKLQTVILPLAITEQIEVETLLARSKPFIDREELLDVCYRCRQTVAQLTDPGDRCPNCAHPFVRSFVNFEALPLVEFVISNDLTDQEAERIITTGFGARPLHADHDDSDDADDGHDGGVGRDGASPKHASEWQADTGANVITFGEDNIDYQIDQQLVAMGRAKAAANKSGDPFVTQLQYVTRPNRVKGLYQPFEVNADMLKHFRRDEIYIVKPRYGSLPVASRYYRLVERDANVVLCESCQHFFAGEDYEYECMKGSGCPLCRYKPGRQAHRTLRETMLLHTAPEGGSAAQSPT